jgi:uncharacterized membrane protein
MKLSAYQIISLLIYAFIMGACQLLMVKASKQLGNNFNDKTLIYAIFVSHWLYIAITVYIIATCLWLLILYKADIRLAYPIASTSVIFAALLQSAIDNSNLPINYWIGLVLVVMGLIMINSR